MTESSKDFVPFPEKPSGDLQKYLKRLKLGSEALSYLQKENLPFAITPEISPDTPPWLVACIRASASFGIINFIRLCRHNLEYPELQIKFDIISTALIREMLDQTWDQLKDIEGNIDQDLISKYEPFIQNAELNTVMEILINNGEVDKLTPENFPIRRAFGEKTTKIMLIQGLINRKQRLERIVDEVITKHNELGLGKKRTTRKSWVEKELELVNSRLSELIYGSEVDI